MAYADIGKVDQLLNGEVKKRHLATLVDICAAKADALIDSYIASRVTLPLVAPYPPIIQHVAQDLTLYYLLRTGFFDGVAGNDKATTDKLWEDCMDLLGKLKDGDIEIPGTGTITDEDQISSTTEDYTPVFDMGDDTDFVVDPDLLEDIKDSKG